MAKAFIVLVLSFSLTTQAVFVRSTAICGNGVVEVGEQCDLATQNGIASSGCSSQCKIVPQCANNIAEPGEQCDFGTAGNPSCSPSCGLIVAPSCGNGVVDAGEQCDSALTPATCNKDCTVSSCGDGKINANAGEQCDGHGWAVTCNNNCQLSFCGDTIVNAKAGEQCDDGQQTAACNWNCQFSTCGDGIVNQLSGEQCDNGSANSPQGPCSTTCRWIATSSTTSGVTTAVPTTSSNSGTPVGLIVGVTVGVVAFVAIAGTIGFFVAKRFRTQSSLGPRIQTNPHAHQNQMEIE